MRQTGRGIIIRDGNILLIERWRDNLHYFSIPGGGVEPGETPEQAVLREVAEETSVQIKRGRLLYEATDEAENTEHYLYLCDYVAGEPHMSADAPELQAGPNNRFSPCWVPIDELAVKPFIYWRSIQELLVADLKNGFDKNVKVTTVSWD